MRTDISEEGTVTSVQRYQAAVFAIAGSMALVVIVAPPVASRATASPQSPGRCAGVIRPR